VAVVPGEAFGTDRHVRISYAASMEQLERGMDRLHQFMVKNS
jgi:aspartate aminotransferase